MRILRIVQPTVDAAARQFDELTEQPIVNSPQGLVAKNHDLGIK